MFLFIHFRFHLETLRDTSDNYFKIPLPSSPLSSSSSNHPNEVSGIQEFKPIITQQLPVLLQQTTSQAAEGAAGSYYYPQQVCIAKGGETY